MVFEYGRRVDSKKLTAYVDDDIQGRKDVKDNGKENAQKVFEKAECSTTKTCDSDTINLPQL